MFLTTSKVFLNSLQFAVPHFQQMQSFSCAFCSTMCQQQQLGHNVQLLLLPTHEVGIGVEALQLGY